WARVFSLASEGAATAFPFLLGSYLLGIAGGSAYVGRHCERDVSAKFQSYLRTLALFVLAVNVAGYALVPLLGQVTRFSDYHFGYLLVALAAGGAGCDLPPCFPSLCEPQLQGGSKDRLPLHGQHSRLHPGDPTYGLCAPGRRGARLELHLA